MEARLVVSDHIVYRARLPPIVNDHSFRLFEARRKSMSDAEQSKTDADQPTMPCWILGVTAFLAGYLIFALYW